MIENKTSQLSDLLEKIAAAIDLPEKAYARAYKTYKDVGDWLSEPGSSLEKYDPHVYIQGSMRVGTTNRPILPKEEVDADAVSLLQIKKENTTQERLKNLVGDRLKENDEFRAVLKDGRRCWTLDYPSNFHMDILPAIPNEKDVTDGILITDKELHNWQFSNPIGYANWFLCQAGTQFQRRREAIAELESLSVDDVPNYRVKTPLQKTVQLLKRHRDIYCLKMGDNKPISIIITTLSGRAFNGTANLLEAFTTVALTMRDHIEEVDGKYVISNPVELEENFAEKWEEHPEREESFFDWLEKLESDVQELCQIEGLHKFGEVLERMFGKDASIEAIKAFTEQLNRQRESGALKWAAGTGTLGSQGKAVSKNTFYGEVPDEEA